MMMSLGYGVKVTECKFSISNSKKKNWTNSVILLLNLSGKIDLNSLPSSIRDYPIYRN